MLSGVALRAASWTLSPAASCRKRARFELLLSVITEWHTAQVRKVTRSRSQVSSQVSSTSRAATASIADGVVGVGLLVVP